MDENPTKLHVETNTTLSPYVQTTGKMTKKETREQAGKNKSILNWARSIPEGRAEDCQNDIDIGPGGWKENINSSKQTVSIVTRKAIAETDEIPENDAELEISNSLRQRVSIVMRKALAVNR